MLKDLDQRQVEQEGSSNFTAPVVSPSSNKKMFILGLIVIILLNLAGIFVWQMYTENQSLKMSTMPEINHIEKQAVEKNVAMPVKSEQSLPNSEMLITSNASNQENINESINNNNGVMNANSATNKLNKSVLAETVPRTTTSKVEIRENPGSEIDTPAMPIESLIESSNNQQESKPSEVKKSTLKISRKQLTPGELARQKLKRAEQALDVNDVSKAEGLFEEVLLVMPEHKSARKQLAALWFGRQSYTDALNLLSQGIDLSPNDSELRVMKARIYLQQNRIQQAFATLNNMPRANDVINKDYQSLRATTAQQLNEYSFAAQAYQILVNIEPAAGRWWLGLAVALDSDSKFKQASIAYQTALNQTGLSGSAEKFARQRITELGE
jgi:MSHA biogenesis protein MshN